MRDGFVGVKNFHIAPITDVESLTYDTPVDVGSKAGLVAIQASRDTNETPAYANDEVWLTGRTDNGGTGTISIRDIGDAEVRELIADLSGYLVTTEGDVLALSGVAPKPCAILCEQTGYIHGRRKLFYYVELGKPDFEANTKENEATVGQIDIPFTYRPVELAAGVVATTRDSFYGNSTYENFFQAVVKTTARKTTGTGGGG